MREHVAGAAAAVLDAAELAGAADVVRLGAVVALEQREQVVELHKRVVVRLEEPLGARAKRRPELGKAAQHLFVDDFALSASSAAPVASGGERRSHFLPAAVRTVAASGATQQGEAVE